MTHVLLRRAACLGALIVAPALWAGEVEIVEASATKSASGWRFDVTLRHGDTGWDHYADGWEVLDAEGTRLGYRKLHHPHVTEQPFTRSLGGVRLPEGTTEVTIRAHDNVHGWSDAVFVIPLGGQ